MADLSPPARAPLLLLGFVSLVIGIAGGLVRLNAGVPAPGTGVAWHGALMASAFFGTLIALERAVAIGRLWAYAAPAASGLGGIAVAAGGPSAGLWLLASGAALFGAASLEIWRRHRALHTGVLALGALCLLAANLWLAFEQAPGRALPFWIAFFVLTIGGERLGLSPHLPVPPAVGADTRRGGEPVRLLLRAHAPLLSPIVPRRRPAIASGSIASATGSTDSHAGGRPSVLLGFVFSMVFGHAPVIFPAVLRVSLPYGAAFYGPLIVLHASVLLRLVADLADSAALRTAGGIGNALAIVFFILTAAALALTARR